MCNYIVFCSVKKTKTCSCHDRHLSPTNVTRLSERYARQPGVTTVTRVTSVTLLAERSLFLHLSLFFFFHNFPLTPFNPKLIPINFQTSTTSFHHIYIHYPYHHSHSLIHQPKPIFTQTLCMQMANNLIPGITLRNGEAGETQRTRFLKFQRRGIHPTRFVDTDCL